MIPPLPDEVVVWIRHCVLDAHWVPQARMYEPLTYNEQCREIERITHAAFAEVRNRMLACGELEATDTAPLEYRVGPAAPVHPRAS